MSGVTTNYKILFNTLAARCTNISYLEIGLKSSIFQSSYQQHSSSADYAEELFKPSKDLASLWVSNETKFLVLAIGFFE